MDSWVLVDLKHSGKDEHMTVSTVIRKPDPKLKLLKRVVKVLKFIIFISVPVFSYDENDVDIEFI